MNKKAILQAWFETNSISVIVTVWIFSKYAYKMYILQTVTITNLSKKALSAKQWDYSSAVKGELSRQKIKRRPTCFLRK